MRENGRSFMDFVPRANDIGNLAVNVVIVAGAVGCSLILPALGAMMGLIAFQFLCNKYQKG